MYKGKMLLPVLLGAVLALASCADAKDSPLVYPKAWSPAQRIPGSSGEAEWPRIAVDSHGIVHIVWDDNEGIWYTNTSSWGTVVLVAGSWSAQYSNMAVDCENVVHVVWEDPANM